MSKRRSWAKLNQSPARWVTYDENGADEDVPTVPCWFALPMPEPWDFYLWHQWPSAWVEVTLRVCSGVWRNQGAKLYDAQKDAELRADLKDWLWVQAVEIAADFIPDPWHPNPHKQWGNYLRKALTHRARHHFGEVVGSPLVRAGEAAIMAYRAGIDSLEYLDEVEADTGVTRTRHPLHGHRFEAADPALVLVRLESLEREVDNLERQAVEPRPRRTNDGTCYITGCPRLAYAAGLCRSDYNKERKQRAPNCIEDGCTNPQTARKRCQTHYNQFRLAAIKAGTWHGKGFTKCSEPDCDKPSDSKGMCSQHYIIGWRARRKAQLDE